VLTAAGLLDELRATTHWLGASELARRFPAVSVDANVLFIDNGQNLTSQERRRLLAAADAAAPAEPVAADHA
jgi:transcriptional regulator GlxA family with amidase domain